MTQDLEPGEWLLGCAKCGWQLEKNTACKTECPECKAPGLLIVTNNGPIIAKDVQLLTREV